MDVPFWSFSYRVANMLTTVPTATKARASLAPFVIWICTIVAIACVAVPMYVIRPFRPQGAHELTVALALRQIGPVLSAACFAIALLTFVLAWPQVKRLTRAALIAGLILTATATVLARINIFEKMFHPYSAPAFDAASAAKIDADDMVMAVDIGGDARAYPIRAMGYHHIVNDTVGGVPLAATYCTLCHTGLVWKRVVDGTTLHFRLAGINNGNALMRDEETSTIWQQTTGRGIFGPLKGRQLDLIHSDELTFALWRKEQPKGTVLRPDAQYASEYESKEWEKHISTYKSVVDTSGTGVPPRQLMIGVTSAGASKAYPIEIVHAERLIEDRLGSDHILVVVGPDDTSIRVFKAHPDGETAARTFYRASGGDTVMTDAETRSQWNFKGCAIAGTLSGRCLRQIDSTKDYWFDWLNYHPDTARFRN